MITYITTDKFNDFPERETHCTFRDKYRQIHVARLIWTPEQAGECAHVTVMQGLADA